MNGPHFRLKAACNPTRIQARSPLATMLVSIPLVLGFFADRHPAFDSVGHFRAHLAVLLAARRTGCCWHRATGSMACWPRARRGCTMDDAFVVFLSGPGQRRGRAPRPASARSTACCSSICASTTQTPEQVLSLIGRVQADVITLDEVSAAWQPRLQQISADVSLSIVCDSPRPFGGIAILSRRPIASAAPADVSTAAPSRWRRSISAAAGWRSRHCI